MKKKTLVKEKKIEVKSRKGKASLGSVPFGVASIPVVIYRGEFSGDFSITWMSEKVKLSTGFSYKEFKYKKSFWESRLHPDDKARVLRQFEELNLARVNSVQTTYRWLHKDGTYHWYIDQASLVKDSKETPQEIIGTWVDVSLYVQAKNALLENEFYYRELVELCPQPILINVEGKITFANSAAVELFGGVSSLDLVGRTVFDFLHPDYRAFAEERTRKILENHERQPLSDFKIITLKGEVKDVEIAASPLTYEGSVAVQSVIVDVTRYKKAEDIYKAEKAELEQLNRLLLKRQLSNHGNEAVKGKAHFDANRSVLSIGDHEVKIRKFSKQYYLLQIMLKDAEAARKDWQFSEISEGMDMEAEFEWKKLYNIADAVKKNIAIETGIKDFFLLTTQSIKINQQYL